LHLIYFVYKNNCFIGLFFSYLSEAYDAAVLKDENALRGYDEWKNGTASSVCLLITATIVVLITVHTLFISPFIQFSSYFLRFIWFTQMVCETCRQNCKKIIATELTFTIKLGEDTSAVV